MEKRDIEEAAYVIHDLHRCDYMLHQGPWLDPTYREQIEAYRRSRQDLKKDLQHFLVGVDDQLLHDIIFQRWYLSKAWDDVATHAGGCIYSPDYCRVYYRRHVQQYLDQWNSNS